MKEGSVRGSRSAHRIDRFLGTGISRKLPHVQTFSHVNKRIQCNAVTFEPGLLHMLTWYLCVVETSKCSME